jgi:hypothetical protein
MPSEKEEVKNNGRNTYQCSRTVWNDFINRIKDEKIRRYYHELFKFQQHFNEGSKQRLGSPAQRRSAGKKRTDIRTGSLNT